MLIALNLGIVGQCLSLFTRVGNSLEHNAIQVDRDIAESLHDLKDVARRHTLLQRGVDNVPELSALGLIAPVLAEEPPDEDQVLNVVLVVLVGEVGIKVA